MSTRSVFLISAFFVLMGCVVFAAFSGVPLMRLISAWTWAELPCTILSSQVGVHQSSDDPRGGQRFRITYSIDITYKYAYADVSYTSDRYNFLQWFASPGYSGKQAVVKRFPPGTAAVCYVNPGNPSEAVLSRTPSIGYFLGSFGLILVALGMMVFYGVYRQSRAVPVRGPSP